MGITTPISTNYAMTIGGLQTGVTPLDMAHAYETIAHGGQRVTGTLAGGEGLPVGIQEVSDPTHTLPNGHHLEVNHAVLHRILPPEIAETETQMLETVITHGTGTAAAIGQFAAGKTGTTSNYVDAWFVGWDSKYTVAVWVGYPQGAKPMSTAFDGAPVLRRNLPRPDLERLHAPAIGIEHELAAHGGSHSALSSGTAATTTTTAPEAGGGATTTRSQSHGSSGAAARTGLCREHRRPGNARQRTLAASAPATQAPQGPASSSPSAPAEQPSTPAGGATGGASAPTGGASAGG